MGNLEIILWSVFIFSAILFWWVGKSFMSQPDYDVPRIFRNPVVGKILVLLPQLGFLIVIIFGFISTENGWWFLGAVIAVVVFLSSEPQLHGVDIHIPQKRLNISNWDNKLIPEKSNSNENSGSAESENINTSKTIEYKYGTLVHQEVKAVLDTVDTYLSQFGDKKPESITLNPFEWAVMDLTLRQSTGNTGSLHTHGYNDLRINCKANRCYCHHFLDDPEVREIVKTLNNYLEIMENKAPTNLPIDDAARQKLNNRFEYFFDGAFNLDSKPHLALQIVKVTGQELYKTNNI